MDLRFVEAGGNGNWGKFAVGRFTEEEYRRPVQYPGCEPPPIFAAGAIWTQGLVASQGWDKRRHALVLDLATGEGALFSLGGYAKADLEKHRIWVCPLFEPFLTWLYEHVNSLSETWWDDLPSVVELPASTPFSLAGYRRPGPEGAR